MNVLKFFQCFYKEKNLTLEKLLYTNSHRHLRKKQNSYNTINNSPHPNSFEIYSDCPSNSFCRYRKNPLFANEMHFIHCECKIASLLRKL